MESLGRSLLAVAGVVIFCLAAAHADEPHHLRHDLSEEELTKLSDTLRPEGYRPTGLSAYDAAGEERYAVIWEKREGAPWQTRQNMNTQTWQDNFDALLGLGFRPVNVTAHNATNGDPRFSGVWERRGGDPWAVRVGLSPDDAQQAAAEYAEKGMVPVNLSGYNVAGAPRFAGVWEKTSDKVELQLDLSTPAADFPQSLKARKSDGYRPVSISGYTAQGKLQVASVWTKGPAGNVETRFNLTGDELNAVEKDLPQRGYSPTSLTAWSIDGKPRFAGIWEKTRRN